MAGMQNLGDNHPDENGMLVVDGVVYVEDPMQAMSKWLENHPGMDVVAQSCEISFVNQVFCAISSVWPFKILIPGPDNVREEDALYEGDYLTFTQDGDTIHIGVSAQPAEGVTFNSLSSLQKVLVANEIPATIIGDKLYIMAEEGHEITIGDDGASGLAAALFGV